MNNAEQEKRLAQLGMASVAVCAHHSGHAPSTIYRAITDGKVHASAFGGRQYVHWVSFVQWVGELMPLPETAASALRAFETQEATQHG
jgi:hypothetical protein